MSGEEGAGVRTLFFPHWLCFSQFRALASPPATLFIQAKKIQTCEGYIPEFKSWIHDQVEHSNFQFRNDVGFRAPLCSGLTPVRTQRILCSAVMKPLSILCLSNPWSMLFFFFFTFEMTIKVIFTAEVWVKIPKMYLWWSRQGWM